MKLTNLNPYTYLKVLAWEQGQISVECCFLTHLMFEVENSFFFMPIDGVLENSTLQKHDNMPYFSQNIFLNVKIIEKLLRY